MKNNEILNVLSDKTKKEIILYLNESVENFLNIFENSNFDDLNIESYFYFLVNLLDSENFKDIEEKIKENIIKILEYKKTLIYQGTSENLRGILDGVLLFSYSLYKLKDIANMKIKNFLKYFQIQSEREITYFLEEVKKRSLVFSYYDLISGCSGFLRYLLNVQSKNLILIDSISEYLISLADEKKYRGKNIINFHIEGKNQFQKIEKITQPYGHVNFGLAHGIISSIIVLSEVFKKNGNKKIKHVIDKLIKLYEKVENNNDVLSYPMQLSYEDYVSETYKGKDICSWCYGNIGIVRGLMIVYKNIQDKLKYNKYKEELIKIISRPIDDYKLECPYICHGYAGVIAIQLVSYKETKDKRFLNKLNQNIEAIFKLEKENFIGKEDYQEDIGLIEGQGGVILTLLGVFTEEMLFKDMLLI
ncbi:lanthionine synthetase LanC family protein [Gemelliphila asaccharolytica]|uniref:Lanthionine synthetase C-like protein n=1 Tax=Gemelliphila asaccharolytica TaxID=502393 RepID=A0ABR5TLL5_9BACL|nr:lanthionine synthetase LanC family protein [Gemella asaccharolytica]KXB57851.1 lanthionine synthetase C-like protein [Gemella asaccharolytica]